MSVKTTGTSKNVLVHVVHGYFAGGAGKGGGGTFPLAMLIIVCVRVASIVGEKLISVGLCPNYKPDCGNDQTQTGAKVGDACAIACQPFNGARWCPTTSDHSGNGGTPWGWCPQFQSGDMPTLRARKYMRE